MNQEEKEYLEGQIRGLQIVRDELINALARLMRDLPAEVDFRVRVSTGISNAIDSELTTKFVETPFGQGVRDEFAESQGKFLGK